MSDKNSICKIREIVLTLKVLSSNLAAMKRISPPLLEKPIDTTYSALALWMGEILKAPRITPSNVKRTYETHNKRFVSIYWTGSTLKKRNLAVKYFIPEGGSILTIIAFFLAG